MSEGPAMGMAILVSAECAMRILLVGGAGGGAFEEGQVCT